MIGIVDNISTRSILNVPILGSVADIPRIIDEFAVDEVIIALPESTHQELVGIISLCEREKVGIRVLPDAFGIMASEVTIGYLGGLPLVTVRDVALQGWKLTLKRGMDLVGSAIGLVILSPFLMLVALLIKLDSPGPVFYTHERMGLDAKSFKILKIPVHARGRGKNRTRLDGRKRSPPDQNWALSFVAPISTNFPS